MTDSIGVRPWMSDAATQAVMNALEAAGGAGCARFVGGCVRNTLLNRPVDDIDIATSLLPDETIKAIEAAGLRAIPTGIEHGTVTAISNSRPFEITTLRHDVETDGRHAVVAFTDDWAQDAARRDFRLNALYADAAGAIFDPTGEGVADAKAGRIVFVGDPATRIEEDYLRILRFFRFFAWYGRGEADAAALAACGAARDMLTRCSAERIAKELLKLLAADDPRGAVRLLVASGVLGVILPEAGDLSRFEGLVEVETEQLFTCDPDLRLAALVAGDEAALGAMADRLRLSNAQRGRLQAAAGEEPRIVSWMSPREARRAVYALGQNAFADRIKLAWAAADRSAVTPQWRGLLALAETWTPPPFPISGDEILSAGVPKGPLVGQVRREVETWWVDQDFLEDKFSAIERLKAVAQGLAY